MKLPNDPIERRRFLQLMAVTGLSPWATGVASATADVPATAAPSSVPRRKLGKTGVEISCVGLGATMGYNSPLGPGQEKEIFARALDFGINYWDTASSYKTEPFLGDYFRTHKGLREKIFLCTKPDDLTTPRPVIADVQKSLEQSLRTMNTDYIDLFLGVHAMPNPECLTDELRQFAETAKKKGLIRFFGFSNHANTANNLAAAAKLDWIDALLVAYNYRQVKDEKVQAGLDACVKSDIGLVAIKAQGFGATTMTGEEQKLTAHFTDKGFDPMQAKLKLVLEDKRFAAAAVGMKRVEIVQSCAGAATDNTKLGQADKQALEQHAAATCSGYCVGCAQICGAALPGLPRVSDIMRYLMYCNSYGERELARGLFARFPAEARAALLAADYRQAEALCPQRVPIAARVAEAFRTLA
jgi:uncharacterized protein